MNTARTNGVQGGRHRVAIVGGGFGGLFAARALRGEDVDVTVIDRTNHHLFQPLLYQVATGILSEGEIAPPIRDSLRRQANDTVLLGEVVDIDVGARLLVVDALDRRTAVPYDSLIVAAGASQSYFGDPGFAADAPGMKTIDHALELRGRIFGAFEMAEHERDPVARRRWLTIVVVGAGPTGVELAGQLAELTRRPEPVEKPSRLQLAIMEWQRQLVDKARMAHDEGQSNGNGGAAAGLH